MQDLVPGFLKFITRPTYGVVLRFLGLCFIVVGLVQAGLGDPWAGFTPVVWFLLAVLAFLGVICNLIAQSIRMRGSVAKVHLLTDGSHGLPEGTLVVAPTLKYLEQAYDASKYGEISRAPCLEVTTSGHVVSIHFQFASYCLKHGDWMSERATLESRPEFKSIIDEFAQAKNDYPAALARSPGRRRTTWGSLSLSWCWPRAWLCSSCSARWQTG